MPFTKEDKILIKNLFELKGYNARHIIIICILYLQYDLIVYKILSKLVDDC